LPLLVLSGTDEAPPSLRQTNHQDNLTEIAGKDLREYLDLEAVCRPGTSATTQALQVSLALNTQVCQKLAFDPGLIDQNSQDVRV